MNQALVYSVALAIFFGLLVLALWLTIKTISVLFQRQSERLVLVAVLATGVLFLLFFLSRSFNEYLYRAVLNYLGVVHFSFLIALAAWLLALLYRLFKGRWPSLTPNCSRALGALYIGLCIGVVAVASYNFNKEEAIVELQIVSNKLTRPVSFVHISDIQYGTTSKQEMVDKLRRVYSLKPEFIVFTGDLVDFEGYATEDFDVLKESPVPIYFERGNHEFYHDPTRLLSDLNQIDTLRLLINKMDSIGEIDIVGIDFGRTPGYLGAQFKNIPLSKNRFSILLYHEPVEIPLGVAHGFDLLLYGHTHGGQIWPFTWLIDWMYEFGDGLFQVEDSTVYTSDGLSLWGPRMRLGSQNEIVVVNLIPDKAEQ